MYVYMYIHVMYTHTYTQAGEIAQCLRAFTVLEEDTQGWFPSLTSANYNHL